LLSEVDKEAYTMRELRMPQPVTRSIRTDGLADSGAQMTFLCTRELAAMGFWILNLIPVFMRIVPADDNAMRGQGMVLVKITGKATDGREVASR
jgi:hypothetical protein